jgi:hypothetical protein
MDLPGHENRVFVAVNGRQQYTDLAAVHSGHNIGIPKGVSHPGPDLLGKMVA